MSVATYAAVKLLHLLPRVHISRTVGRLSEAPLPPVISRAITEAYCKAYRVDMAEVAPRSGAYESFDAFFTRPLRDGCRAIDASTVVSPADGMLSARGSIDASARLQVKGRPYDVAELTGDAEDEARYLGGSFAVVYLSPRDYHRVHSPVDGDIVGIRGIPGDLYPVNRIGERHVPRLFAVNNRVCIVIDTPAVGRVTVVMVGAMIVGRISVSALPVPAPSPGWHPIEPRQNVQRGEEIGVFHLGSTVVMLLEQGHDIVRPEGPVRYGDSLMKAS